MARIERFKELKVWQKARALCRVTDQLTRIPEFSKDYSLKDQIKRSSGSVMDNIAEGFDRQSSKEFRQFLFIAKGSCSEVKSQLYRAFDFDYINEKQLVKTQDNAEECGRMLGGLIKYLNRKIEPAKKVEEPKTLYGSDQSVDLALNLPDEFYQQ
ncbi:MAG: four helix bundle protein [Flavobacteriales bacterium]|nr:four helix bundle protein [Flavobacteriales bacterium]